MMYMKVLLSLHLLLFFMLPSGAQTARQVGLRENTPSVFAFVNADIVTGPGNEIRGATMVVRDGMIESLGRRVSPPPDAMVIDMEGKRIYPGFIDLATHYGLDDLPGSLQNVHWNPQIRAHLNSATYFSADEEMAAVLRSQGFVLAHTMPSQGLLRGRSSLVSLGKGSSRDLIVAPNIIQHMAFVPSDDSGRSYPTSTMGAIALLRQTFIDAGWHAGAHAAYLSDPSRRRPEINAALASLIPVLGRQMPLLVDVANENQFVLASQLANEFEVDCWIIGSGHEYRRLDAIAATGLPLILPIDFPSPPDVEKPEQAVNVSLETLRHWYLAPDNPSILEDAGLLTAITASGSGKDFLENLRTAVERGLDEGAALAALTTRPAGLVRLSHLYGSLEPGKVASFIVTDGGLFQRSTQITGVWIDGQSYELQEKTGDPRGEWVITAANELDGSRLSIDGRERNLRGKIVIANDTIRLSRLQYDSPRLSFVFHGEPDGLQGTYRLSAHLGEESMLGAGENDRTEFFTWEARRASPARIEKDAPPGPPEALQLPARFPSMEYGFAGTPEQPAHIIVRNATIWTQGPDGVMHEADMLVSRGRIAAVGHNIDAPRGAVEIDATGRHLTPGLIDPHIHASIAGGVNETGDAITSETRITDVMHGDNVWIYRLLAGGITSATLFHGSANPIGGQNAVIKMRWGMMGDGLLYDDAAPGLKFALGENVKRSADRYPSSRQGTEQIIRDALQAAVEYGRAKEARDSETVGLPHRRDLQLEAILEVIRGTRRAHVHAYRQDEMLMMMRLAEEFGFTIGSFEHTLEGYKIADEMRQHGAAAVVWTDWSSFKVEAYDGILHNARLLHDAGVLTSLHSDNTQLSTRMNWEAAKTMMTGVSEVDAMDFITMHPAMIMGIDHRTGSLEVGKDADFVIWNGHPLSTFTTADQTWVDGRKYFDREQDRQLRGEVREERGLIIDHILEHQQGGRQNNSQ